MLNSGNFAGNQFVNFSLMSLTELPSAFIGQLVIDHLGRRWSNVGCMAGSMLAQASSYFCATLMRFDHTGSKFQTLWISSKVREKTYSLLFNTSHGILIKEKWNFPLNLFIPAWSWGKSLPCLLLQPGLKPFFVTSKQCWCHCYIYRGLLCSVFQPGLWVIGMACLVIQTCFWKKFGMSPNTTWLVLKRKE